MARIHEGDFFDWVNRCDESFDCAVGNPPFIRYQLFAGSTRTKALALCRSMGADFSALTSSWAPFLVATCATLNTGGQIAFVVPAEIGHAPYARPLLRYMCANFGKVHIVAVREKLFPQLSEDAWLLYASEFGCNTREIRLTVQDRFRPSNSPPRAWTSVSLEDVARWHFRLRPFLLSEDVRRSYSNLACNGSGTVRLSALANVGIGYVTSANDFFHLRPSEAARLGIERRFFHPTVRTARGLPLDAVTSETVDEWTRADQPAFLLRLNANQTLPKPIQRYLDSARGHKARAAYKCRNRKPWYVVPDVRTPHAFLSYMSGLSPVLVANRAGCACANAVHAVVLRDSWSVEDLQTAWRHPLTQLSCEIEGHPLGGGMLKLEPREAGRVLLPGPQARISRDQIEMFEEAIATMRVWRHYV